MHATAYIYGMFTHTSASLLSHTHTLFLSVLKPDRIPAPLAAVKRRLIPWTHLSQNGSDPSTLRGNDVHCRHQRPVSGHPHHHDRVLITSTSGDYRSSSFPS